MLVNTKLGELKEQSYYNLQSQIRGLNVYIGDMYIKDIKKSHIEQIRATLIKEEKIDTYNKQYITKIGAGTRKIPIASKLYPILKAYCKDRVGILFLSEYGNYIGTSTFRKRWNTMLKKLQEFADFELANDITPHMFRHTYTSDLYKAGVDIKSAQYLLGHTDIKTTLNVYTHFGYVDVKIDKIESYYEDYAVKMQSERNKKLAIPLK